MSFLFSPELIKPYETIALNVHKFQFKFLRIHSLILRIVLILKWKCFLLFYLRIFTRFADLMAFVIRLVVLRFILRLPFYSRAKKNKTATIDKRIDKMCTQLYTGMNDTNFLSLSFPSFAFAATF